MPGVAAVLVAPHELLHVNLVAILDQETDFFETLDGLVRARLHNPVNHLNDVLVDAGVVCLGLEDLG